MRARQMIWNGDLRKPRSQALKEKTIHEMNRKKAQKKRRGCKREKKTKRIPSSDENQQIDVGKSMGTKQLSEQDRVEFTPIYSYTHYKSTSKYDQKAFSVSRRKGFNYTNTNNKNTIRTNSYDESLCIHTYNKHS